MRRSLFISLLLFNLVVIVNGQVIDTTKSINTWKLMHNFTRFEEVPLDTNMHQLHRDYQPAFKEGFSYESLGILGHAMNHVDFFLRPESDFFLFGRAWNPYLKTPARTLFFNTKKPFTSLAYSTHIALARSPEENVEVLHTQNASPFTNFGIEFNILSGRELYPNQETRVNRFGLFGSHVHNKYSIFGTFYFNDFKRLHDNGGLANPDDFLTGAQNALFEYDVQLLQAKSTYRNISLFATQKYNLAEPTTTTDTLGNQTVSGKTLSLSHQLYIDRHMKTYSDVVNLDALSPVYDYYYYLVSGAKDSVSEDRISNVFQLILGDPDYDKISARVYAGHDFRRFGMLSPRAVNTVGGDTVEAWFNTKNFNDLHTGFYLAGPTTGIWDWVIDGKYYVAGYYQHDVRINATFSRQLADKARLGIRGSFELRQHHYFTNHYSSSFFQWDNNFPSMARIKGEAFLKSDELETDLRAGAAYISNYVYWDQDALPVLYDQDLLILSGSFSKHFKLSGYNSDTRLLVQYTTAGEVLRLPLAVIYSSNYWKQSLFKGALITDLGFDLYYTTRYRASAYMPATGIFYLQNAYEAGGYPFLDVFMAFRISRTRIFISYSNLLHGLGFVGNNYFTTYRYPMKPRNLRIGLVWTFYN